MSTSRPSGLRTGLVVLFAVPLSLTGTGAEAAGPEDPPRLSGAAAPDCGTYRGQGCADPAERIDLAPPVRRRIDGVRIWLDAGSRSEKAAVR